MINGLEILPDWLFLENEIVSGSYTSSTTGRFAPAVGMDASGHQSPWKQSIPSEQKPDRVKKTVVVNDFVLADPFYDSDDFVHKLNVLEQLIDAGFDLYLLRPNEAPQALKVPLNVADFTKAPIPNLALNEATRLLTQAIPDIDADHIALCTNKKLDDLVNLLAFEKPLSYLKNKARMHKRDIARRESLVFYYEQTGIVPHTEYSLPTVSPENVQSIYIEKLGAHEIQERHHLKKLHIHISTIGEDNLIDWLDKTPNIESLKITSSQLTPIDVTHKAGKPLQYLTEIDFTGSSISTGGLWALLKRAPYVTSIIFPGIRIYNSGSIDDDLSLDYLIELNISSSALSKDNIQAILNKTSKLTRLTLTTAQFKYINNLDRSLFEHISELKIIQKDLYLSHNDRVLSAIDVGNFLKKTPNIKYLELTPAEITGDIGWDSIPLEALSVLKMESTIVHSPVPPKLTEQLTYFGPPVYKFIISSGQEIVGCVCSEIPRNCNKMRQLSSDSLNRWSSTLFSTFNFFDIPHMPNIRHLDLSLINFPNNPSLSIPPGSSLGVFHFSFNQVSFENNAVDALNLLLNVLQTAKVINAGSIPSWDEQQSHSFTQSFPNLVNLDISKSPCMNPVIAHILKNSPNLRSLTLKNEMLKEAAQFIPPSNRITVVSIPSLKMEDKEQTINFFSKLHQLRVVNVEHYSGDNISSSFSEFSNNTVYLYCDAPTAPPGIDQHTNQHIPRMSRTPSSPVNPDNITTISGTKRKNKVHVRDNTAPATTSIIMPLNKAKYTMYPVCERIDGQATPFEKIRKRLFRYDFSSIDEDAYIDSLRKRYVQYDSAERPMTAEPADHQFNYRVKPRNAIYSEENKCWLIQLWSLTQEDIIVDSVSLGEKSYAPRYCKASKSHYIVLDQEPTEELSVSFKVKTPRDPHQITELPNELQSLFEEFNQPFEKFQENAAINSTMKNMRKNIKHYPCGVRTLVFLYNLHTMNIPNFTALGCESGDHAWVELVYDGKPYTLDLGGAAVHMVYEDTTPTSTGTEPSSLPKPVAPTPAPTIPAALTMTHPCPHKHKKPPLPKLNTLDDFKDHLQKQGKNTLFVFDTRKALEQARSYILNTIKNKTIAVNKPADLQSTVPYVALDKTTWTPQDPPGGWIKNQLENPNNTHLLIDWSRFNDGIAKVNGCIDEVQHRKLHNIPINRNMHVIGLILQDSHHLGDDSFISRHGHDVFVIDHTFPLSLNNIFARKADPIELYESAGWMEMLFGSPILDEDNGTYLPGQLTALTESMHLTFNNPPKEDKDFNLLADDLRNGNLIHYHDKSITLPPMSIELTWGYAFNKRSQCVQKIFTNVNLNDLPAVDHVLNPATFERCLHNHYVFAKKYKEGLGWIDSIQQDEMSFYITRSLSIQQYCALLDHAKDKKLTLYLAPDVTLPSELKMSPSAMASSQRRYNIRAILVNTNDADQWIDNNSKNSDIIIDISELSPDDILYRYAHHFDRESKKFDFEEIESDILSALKMSKNVYLTGTFSPAMADHLSTVALGYIWQDMRKQAITGKLFLIPKQKTTLFNWLPIENPNSYAHNDCPALPIYHADEPDTNAEAFQNARFTVLRTALSNHPAILIEGEPGIGKSSFIHTLKQKVATNLFFAEAQVDAWSLMKGTVDDPAVLVIDEATIRNTDFSIFRGLYTQNPHILINGRIRHIDVKTQKIIFLGNTVKNMPSLLQDKVPKLIFKKLSKNFIIDKILKPIFTVASIEDDAEFFYESHKNDSVRVLQSNAIAHCASLNPTHASNSLENMVGFHVTLSRMDVISSLINSLNARHFMRRAGNTSNFDSPKYGGQTGLWIERPSSIGKTEMVREVLKTLQYIDMTDTEIDAIRIGSKDFEGQHRFYEMPAGCDASLMIKRFQKAADQGIVVAFHEMDTALSDELVAAINPLLMGETLQFGRPTVPGFMLIATGNGCGEPGRRQLASSLKSRFKSFTLDEYTETEYTDICAKRFTHLNRPTIEHYVHEGKYRNLRTLIAILNDAINLPVTTINVPTPAPAPIKGVSHTTHDTGVKPEPAFWRYNPSSPLQHACSPQPSSQNLSMKI